LRVDVPPKKPPRRKPMTYIVGVQCRAGIVLCSDSLESDGVSRKMVKKLHHYDREQKWGVAWGCSGDSDVISKFTDKMFRLLRNEPDDCDLLRLQEVIESVGLLDIQANYPNANLAIVAGIWEGHKTLAMRLCKLDVKFGNCLAVQSDYACAGLDTSLGRFVIDSSYHENITISEGVGLAVFTTNLMKETAEGVGGPTQMLSYRIGRPYWKEHEKKYIDRVDKEFRVGEVKLMIEQYWWQKNLSWLPTDSDF
jgi:20S proteasome alpha/beta subunit